MKKVAECTFYPLHARIRIIHFYLYVFIICTKSYFNARSMIHAYHYVYDWYLSFVGNV